MQTGLGKLENLEFDGRGGLIVSNGDADVLVRLQPDGSSATLATGVADPGGLRAIPPHLYVNTGNTAQNAVAEAKTGTVERLALDGSGRTTLARGLTAPNGMAVLPGGDLVVSRALGAGAGVTRVPRSDASASQPNWSPAGATNGLAVDGAGRYLYATRTFTPESPVIRIDITRPDRIVEIARLSATGAPKGLDDMTIDARDVLYLAANASGEVIRLDPGSKATCVIASGLRQPSSVKFGCGPGWPGERLYVTSFDGTVRELAPPPGTEVQGKPGDCATDPGAGRPRPSAEQPRSSERPRKRRRCRSRRRFTIRLRRPRDGGRIVRVRVRVGGKRVAVRRRAGRLVVRVDLRGRRKGKVVVRAVGRTSRGHRYVDRRTYRTCAPR